MTSYRTVETDTLPKLDDAQTAGLDTLSLCRVDPATRETAP